MSFVTIVGILTFVSLVCQVGILILGKRAQEEQTETMSKKLRKAVNDEWNKCVGKK